MANMHLVTGFAGREHVTSIDQGLLNSYIIGDVEAVMKRGSQFEASIISNNIIRVKDGDLLMQGRFARLNDDSYVDVTIENGTQGYFRNDLIVARYQKDAITAVETVDLVVIKGENAASDPVDPAHVKGDIRSGKDFVNDVPLWRVSLEGLSVTGLTCLYSTFSNTLSDLLNHANRHSSGGADPIKPEDIDAVSTATFATHLSDNSNPHQVAAEQVQVSENVVTAMGISGLWSVDGILTQMGGMFNGGATLYQWKKERKELLQTSQTSITYEFDVVGYRTIYYSDTITIGDNGRITLDNPKSVTVNGTNHLKPTGYFAENATNQTTVYKTTDNTQKVNEYDPTDTYQITTLRNIETWSMGVNSSVVVSEDPNAYQDGEVDEEGFTYTALGSQASVLTRMASGSYTGAGTYGEANLNVLTFPFAPKIVFVQSVGVSNRLMWVDGASQYLFNTGWHGGVTVEDRTFKWYGTGAASQLNNSGTEYKWIAIG